MVNQGGGPAGPWLTYEGVDAWSIAGGPAYTYATSYMAIDADGAPNAYHPLDIGLDYLANAGYRDAGWRSVLAVDPADSTQAYRQPSGAFAGYFVSKTSLQNPTLGECDVNRYVDAVSVPYLVFPGGFYVLNGTGAMGDVAMARNMANGKTSYAVIADAGPSKAPLGEVSIGLATALGGDHPSPRTGAETPQGPFRYVVFPGSRKTVAKPWRRDLADIQAQAEGLLAGAGGWAAVDAAYGP